MKQPALTTEIAYAGPDRRDHAVRAQRDDLAEWLELHPRALAEVHAPALGALDLSLQASRAAHDVINSLRHATARLEEVVETLRAEALTDPLTGVDSRRALDMRLAHDCAVMKRTGQRFTVFMLDADNLKRVNDTLGHSSGDELLRQLAHRLRGALRDVDMVARLGGDEFVLVCATDSEEGAAELAGRVRAEMRPGVTLADGLEVPMSVSIGWVVGEPGQEPGALLRLADASMYAAKVSARS